MKNESVEQSFTITPEYDGSRLDRFLAEQLKGISRSELQRWIKNGEVGVNTKAANAHQALKVGDEIRVSHRSVAKETPERWDEIRFIAEEPDFLILSKPSGILVHPTPNTNEHTLIDWLLEQHPELRGVGENPERPGIVHRLDRDVSGILLVARTPQAFTYYKSLFQNRGIEKQYAALVHGVMESDGIIELPISRSLSNRKRMAARSDGVGRPAFTAYHILRSYPHLTLLEVKPKTGRMHQIRVHLNAIGHPIVGDKLYVKRASKATTLQRPFLHAERLSFTDREGRERSFTSPMPAELQDCLQSLDEKHRNS